MSPPNQPTSTLSPALVLDNQSTALLCLNARLAVMYLNAAGEVLLGVSARQIEGQALGVAIPSLQTQEARLREALHDGAPYTERELRLQLPTDAVIVDCTVTPFADGKGGRMLLLEFFGQDRHLRISREGQLVAQQQVSREVIRGLAHEIKNPLGGLRGAAQLLERELTDAGLKDYTRIIIGEADRLQKLVDRLLGPNKPPQLATINLHQPLEHVRQLIEAELSDEITLVRDYDPSIPDLVADPELLIQAFLNLMRNAVQAVGEEGRITIRTRARRRLTIGGKSHRLVAQIDIIDNGPGIPAGMQEQIFYPLVTTRAEGTGLGLPIAQHLIRSHDGLIECETRAGETVFSIYLPLE
jgi:two-component system, NtrC family, nitrogen regulation sensor histidine kinase GlnL